MSKQLPDQGLYINYKENEIFEIDNDGNHTQIYSPKGSGKFTKIEKDGRELNKWAEIVIEGKEPEYIIHFDDGGTETYI